MLISRYIQRRTAPIPCSCLRAFTQGPPRDVKRFDLSKYDAGAITRKDMEWRTSWHQKEASYFNVLRTFYSPKSKTSYLKILHSDIDLRPSTIKSWWKRAQERKAIVTQAYVPERNQVLGNELAAAHFVVHRGGAVKFYNENHWIKADESGRYELPKVFEADKVLEAIDCTDMVLYYEGLQNLKELKQMHWLSLNGVEQIDDWCLDRLSNILSHSLVYLDLRNCPNYTERGLGALFKLENLKILWIDDMLMTTPFEMTCLMLQEVNPSLDIKFGHGD